MTLPTPWFVQLVQGDEHEGAGLSCRRRGFEQDVLLVALAVGPRLHGAHPQGIGLLALSGPGVAKVQVVFDHGVFALGAGASSSFRP